MKKNIQFLLLFVALVSVVAAVAFCLYPHNKLLDILKALAAVLAFNLFVYKLLTGWLIINMTIKIDAKRETADRNMDNLVIGLALNKGSNDSLWLESIDIRVSKIKVVNGQSVQNQIAILKPLNTTKTASITGDYWNGQALEHYTISTGEEANFAAFTQVSRSQIIAVEVLVLGTRPFYGIESRYNKLIQWRASSVILPVPLKG